MIFEKYLMENSIYICVTDLAGHDGVVHDIHEVRASWCKIFKSHLLLTNTVKTEIQVGRRVLPI